MKYNLKYLFLLALILVSCKKNHPNSDPRYGTASGSTTVQIYSFAVHPLYNPNKLMQAYQPLLDYLNSKVSGVKFELEASRDYASFEEKYRAGTPDFILPNPWQTIQAINYRYNVIAMAGEPDDFKGLFIVRKDGNIKTPLDVKGKAISYPSPTALAACIMPQYFLYKSGINVNSDIENRYVGSQESAIMNVYMGLTAVGATWPPPWRAFQKDHPKEAAALKIIWETESLINNSVMARNNIPVEITQQVKLYLTELHKTDQGMKILSGMETARFITASDKDYDVARRYIERFEREVRKLNRNETSRR